MALLDASRQQALDMEGYIVLEGAVSPSVLSELSRSLDAHLMAHGYSDPGFPVRAADAVLQAQPEVQGLLERSGVSMTTLRNEHGLAVSSDQVVSKYPGRFRTPWHQDADALAGRGALTVYLSLSDTPEGALEVVPGSHRHGPVAHVRKVIAQPDKLVSDAVAIPVSAGTIVLLHPHTIHRGLPNEGAKVSTSYTIIFEHIA